ncbi:MAG TPA: hypothetical protein VG125_05450 [Pirellulales bacterium]|jgi:hypothetical protein|nr:hypothetical protein [Pirellulales bacterium]
MKLFLIIVGALVTAFVLCLLILILWLRWVLRKLRGSVENQFGDLAEAMERSIPPFRINLERLPAVEWQQPDEAASLIEPLRQAGFGEVGSFAIQPGEIALVALCRPSDSIYAVVYQHPKAGVWLDLITRYQDGSRIIYCSQRDTLLDRPEHTAVRYYEGTPAQELLSRFLAERPSKPMESMSADDFVGHFEGAYAESLDWMMARGGPTEEEIRRQCEQGGKECTPVIVSTIRKLWSAAIEAFYNRQLQERFLADAQPPAARWEQIRDRLVFVHDRLSPEQLEALCDQEFDEFDEEQEADEDSSPARNALVLTDGSGPPRQAFARWNATVESERRYEKIGELSAPMAADVYLLPNSED